DAGQRAAIGKAARDYLDRARGFLLPAPERLVAIGGLSGTGKSTLAASLAPGIGKAPGTVVLRSDLVRKRHFGKAPTERLGPEAYRPEMSENVYRTLAERARTLLAAGHCPIVDAVFLKPEERSLIARVAAEAGVPFEGLWLEAPEHALVERIEARRGDASDATSEVLRRQQEIDPGPIGWIRLEASGSPETVLKAARVALGLQARDGVLSPPRAPESC
ncbi:MAG: AAA family ATPase, partial [Geminicoccales bacterium]